MDGRRTVFNLSGSMNVKVLVTALILILLAVLLGVFALPNIDLLVNMING